MSKVTHTLAAALGLIASAIMPSVARATVDGLHLTLFPFGGYSNYAKNTNLEDEPLYGGKLGIMLGRYVGIEGHYAWCSTQSAGTTPFSVTPPPPGPLTEVDVNHYGVNLIVNLRPSAFFVPYLVGGWAESKLDHTVTPGIDAQFENGIEFGGGVKLRFNDRIAARAEFRDALWKFDSPPAPDPPGSDAVDNQFYTAGIEFALGGSTKDADSDGDGVSDRKDKCADTPAGCRVDARGCPVDTDRDGVCDGVDQCPDTPAGTQVDARGCPRDADNDGVFDGVDQCADTPAGCRVDARGCPVDTDRDGVCDGLDQCADTPAGSRVDARGCPEVRDSDSDGVNDDVDRCPDTPSGLRVDKDGCPIEVIESEKILMDTGMLRLEDVHFVTAKWDLMDDDKPRLDTVGQVLLRWPQLRIEIGGHADARGSRAYNQDLSQKRVDAVLEYLVTRFPALKREQYTATGFGEDKPIASNTTDTGMAKNRRVEFVVLNKDVLEQEVQRRRLLREGEGTPADTTRR